MNKLNRVIGKTPVVRQQRLKAQQTMDLNIYKKLFKKEKIIYYIYFKYIILIAKSNYPCIIIQFSSNIISSFNKKFFILSL